MTSRITVNNIESNSGVSSIALDTGVTIGEGSGLNVSGIVTATTITGAHTGDASQLTAIPGPNITGTIPLAALGNVDLTGIKKDIALLSLQTAVDTNRVAYNLANSFIDQFENETGISAKTTVTWNGSGEYLSSKTVTSGSPIVYNYDGSDRMEREWKKTKSFIIKNSGYDAYFAMSASTLAQDAEFEVEEGATKAKIKSAFVKSLKTKKLNKKVLGKFMELVA